jgi:chemotaxis protein MotB
MNKQIVFHKKANAEGCRGITFIILTGIIFFFIQGCTLKSTHNKVVDDLEACKARDAETVAKVVQLQNERNSLSEEIKARKKAEAYMTEVYKELLSDFSSEIGNSLLTIEMMKSGVNVNLPHDVLFLSGSADLSQSGKEVLLKVGNELAEIPYQLIVGGFTDNVPVGAKLAEIYPTNWELAGARAARVVRMLEEAGVGKERLRAMSLGENMPIASNDTPEGRAKNRRIQIVLRPVVPGE